MAAAAICLNTMIGAGLFINPGPLTKLAGPLGFLGYIGAALLIFPLLLCVANLAENNPVSGGLYVYSKLYIHPFAGFLSGWGYFIGKTTSACLLMHSFVLFFQSKFLFLAGVPTLYCDYFLIFFLIILNILGMQIGGALQQFFSILKIFPITFGLCMGIMGFNPEAFFVTMNNVAGVFPAIPIAVFASVGFEVICSIGHLIANPQQNIKRIIIGTFAFVVSINIIFQLLLFGALGESLIGVREPLLLLAEQWSFPISYIGNIVNSCVFAAILGSCFSVFTTNGWNLFTLAANNHLIGKSWLTSLNRHNVPWVSTLLEGLLGCFLLTVSNDQVSLQNMSVFGQVIAYILTTYAAMRAVQLNVLKNLPIYIPILGIFSCTGILLLCLSKIFAAGISISFLLLFVVGCILYGINEHINRKKLS